MLAFIIALGLFASPPEQQSAPSPVPAYLLQAAQGPPIEFGMALLSASIPCGLEIKARENRAHSGPVSKHGPDRRVPLPEVLRAFEAAHAEYTAQVTMGVVVIRPRTDLLALLDAQSRIAEATTVPGVTEAARIVFSQAYPGLTSGIVVAAGPLPPWSGSPIVLDGSGGRTVLDTLNQIVTQAPGRGWLVTTRSAEGRVLAVEVKIFDEHGSRRGFTLEKEDGESPLAGECQTPFESKVQWRVRSHFTLSGLERLSGATETR